MKKLVGLIAVGLMVMVMAGPAAADYSYNFNLGDGSYFAGPAFSDPGLVMWAEVNPFLDYTHFTLSSGESWTGNFGKIGTHETAVNPDDQIPQEIYAYIHFDDPDLVAAIGGNTVGFKGYFKSGWVLTWNDPVEIYFGNGNYMTLELSDEDFSSWFGPDGLFGDAYECIDLTVSYSHVPVPAAVWLLGSGLVGLAGLRRKFRA